MIDYEADTLTLDDGRVIAMKWDEEDHSYTGPCPKCGGVFRFASYDDGDDQWNDAYKCDDCDWIYWL